jgi:hypothetical protein
MVAIAAEPPEVQLRKASFARLLENRLQLNAAFCSHGVLNSTMLPRTQLALRGLQILLIWGSLSCDRERSEPTKTLSPIAGTYEFRLCRVRCGAPNEPNTLAIGRLVLSEAAIDTTTHIRSDSARQHLTLQDIWESNDGPANGCFVWHRRRAQPPSYGSSRLGSLVHWTAKGDSLFFLLYRSPDAAHSVSAVRTAAGFQGRGFSSGAGAAEVDWPQDVVLGRWIAPPDYSICNDAADSALAQFRRFIRERPQLTKRLQN